LGTLLSPWVLLFPCIFFFFFFFKLVSQSSATMRKTFDLTGPCQG
jgi:hypothetical protein